MKKSHWIYQGMPFGIDNLQEERFKKIDGFIYRITRDDGKFYIGKKSIWKTRRVVATKKDIELYNYLRKNTHGQKTILKTTMSDWHKYISSCDKLKLDIKMLGKDKFSFEILHFCIGKLQLSYYELKYLFTFGCLEVENCYNDAINERMTRNSIKD